ncbi:MAG: NADP-dependent oxidoreductase [Beijerinckiaceae bacterium]
MRAVGFHEFGGPDVLQVVDLPEVHAGPGEVRIRVHAATVNPTDLMSRNGSRAEQLKSEARPLVAGMEVAGVVDEVGPDVDTGVKAGDAVFGLVVTAGAHGGYREQIVLNARSVALAPKGASHEEAATLPMNGLTARMALDRLGAKAGQTIAVTGAAGAFGGYVMQLAKADGLTVVADAAPKDEALVRSLGADIVLPRGEGFAAAVRARYPDGVDCLADGAVLKELAVPAVRDGGAFNSVRGWPGNGDRGINFSVTGVRAYDGRLELLDSLRQLAEAGRLSMRVGETYPPERAADAHRRLEAGGMRGRILLTF